ncbi:hypothetical protein [Knoellia sp. LjRoot47]|uniref:hypothetical protein n=1 Tax=Knoellia sp. LjRoot47 TaxID=3342330 RepID=UPI003ED02FCF
MDEVVETDYGQMDLVWSEQGGFDGDVERYFAGQTNGLVGAGDSNGVYFHLGRRSGGSRVQIARLDSPPAEPGDLWEDVVEVSLVVPSQRAVRMTSWAAESTWDLAVPAGAYRLRVSAHGRDAGATNEFAEDMVDRYLLELWPAPPEPDAILRVGSDDARSWHAEWGSRRDEESTHVP